MIERIFIAGFGGQGAIMAGKLICMAAMQEGKNISHIPSYGVEMRGGAANCSVVISDADIPSPLVFKPDVLVTLNQQSLKKFVDRLKPGGLLIYNSSLIHTPPERTDITVVPVDANDIAEELGSTRAANMVLIGAVAGLKPEIASLDSVISGLEKVVSSRNKELNELNKKALKAGMDAVMAQTKN